MSTANSGCSPTFADYRKVPFIQASIPGTLGETRGPFNCGVFGDHVTMEPQAYAEAE